MKNREIADLLDRIADALEIKGESGFKVVAYRKASRILLDMTEDIENVAREGGWKRFPASAAASRARSRNTSRRAR